MTEAEYLAAWKAQVAIGKALHPELYRVRLSLDWNSPAKPVSEARKLRRRKCHSRKRPI